MGSYEEFEANRVKHLEMIQAVITRLSNEGFLVKGWAVTVAGVFVGLAINSAESKLALIACLPTIAFWALDTSFLRAERLFRVLHEEVRKENPAIAPFYMAATAPEFVAIAKEAPGKGIGSWWHAFRRPAIRNLYGAIIVISVAVSVVAATMADESASETVKHLIRVQIG